MAPGMGYRFPGRCHVGAPSGRKGVGVMDLTKDDLLLIEQALTRENWRGRPNADLLLRVRTRLLEDHGHRTQDAPTVEGFKVVEPKPKSDKWPELGQG